MFPIYVRFNYKKVTIENKLLYTKGRKTGRKRISPLEYHRIDGVIHIFSGRGEKSHWLGNLKANPDDVKIKVGFRGYDVRPEIIKSKAKRDEIFRWYVKKHPRAAKMLIGWKPGRDVPETADFSLITKFIPVIKLHRKPK